MHPTMTPHSCEICKALFPFPQYKSSFPGGYWGCLPDPHFSTAIRYRRWFCLSFEQAIELAEQGCSLMMWLATLEETYTTPDDQLRAVFAHGSYEQLVLYFENEFSDGYSMDLSRELVLCADSDDLAATEIKVRPPNLNPASIETMESARDWLKTCINTHTMCPKPWSNQTGLDQEMFEKLKPRRLIKLCFDKSSKQSGEGLRLSLVETSNITRPRYAALSYCWGGDQPVKLLRSNLATYFKSIPYDDLPQTLKDAARVTAEVGLEYLWIDALCIVQDDNMDDKPVELAKMAEIYSQAQITLLASRSTKVQDGFLQTRALPSEKAFRIPYWVGGEQSASIILWNGRALGSSEPIDQRAWCFQERVLSNRILEFGTHTTFYRCVANREANHPAETDGWIAESETWADYGTGSPMSLPNNWSSLDPESEEFRDLWIKIVCYYTGLGMTNSEDRLNAISGVARRFSNSSNNSYCVGLWRQHLPELLLWQTFSKSGVKPKSSRIDRYIAPSWSWASTNLPIRFSLGWTSIVCKVLEISVQNSLPGDCFSNAESATLTIRAPIVAATLAWEKPQQEVCNGPPCAFGWGDNCECKNVEAQYQSTASDAQFTVLESEIDLTDVTTCCEEPVDARCNVLLVCITPSDGLIVRQQCEKPETYERIGTFSDSVYRIQYDICREMDLVLV